MTNTKTDYLPIRSIDYGNHGTSIEHLMTSYTEGFIGWTRSMNHLEDGATVIVNARDGKGQMVSTVFIIDGDEAYDTKATEIWPTWDVAGKEPKVQRAIPVTKPHLVPRDMYEKLDGAGGYVNGDKVRIMNYLLRLG
jgi:hypothetical protein